MVIETSVKMLLGSRIAWTDFLKDVADFTGHSPTQGIDAYNYKLSDYAKFIASLGEFREKKELDPIDTLRIATDLLDQLQFGFLISSRTNSIFTIMERTNLKIISTKIKGGRIVLISGTLREWKDAIISCLTNLISWEICWIFNQILDIFFELGLSQIWHNYSKQALDNDTYLLIEKE